MNYRAAILIKLLSVMLFALMSVLVRLVSEKVPVGQVVFFRSLFAIVPLVAIYAYRGELAGAVRTGTGRDVMSLIPPGYSPDRRR